jgi:hypothetical protein
MVHDQVQDHRDTAAVCAVDSLPCLRLPRTGRDDDPAQVPPNQVRCGGFRLGMNAGKGLGASVGRRDALGARSGQALCSHDARGRRRHSATQGDRLLPNGVTWGNWASSPGGPPSEGIMPARCDSVGHRHTSDPPGLAGAIATEMHSTRPDAIVTSGVRVAGQTRQRIAETVSSRREQTAGCACRPVRRPAGTFVTEGRTMDSAATCLTRLTSPPAKR